MNYDVKKTLEKATLTSKKNFSQQIKEIEVLVIPLTRIDLKGMELPLLQKLSNVLMWALKLIF